MNAASAQNLRNKMNTDCDSIRTAAGVKKCTGGFLLAEKLNL
jgi:hypothetical protein